MCVVSFVGDQWKGHFEQQKYDWAFTQNTDNVAREEIKKLREELEFMKKMLIKAKLYDIETGQPDCEMDDKVKFIKELAKKFGVDLKGVFDDDKNKKTVKKKKSAKKRKMGDDGRA